MLDLKKFEKKVWKFEGKIYEREGELRRLLVRALIEDLCLRLEELSIFAVTISPAEYARRREECEKKVKEILEHMEEITKLRELKNEGDKNDRYYAV